MFVLIIIVMKHNLDIMMKVNGGMLNYVCFSIIYFMFKTTETKLGKKKTEIKTKK